MIVHHDHRTHTCIKRSVWEPRHAPHDSPWAPTTTTTSSGSIEPSNPIGFCRRPRPLAQCVALVRVRQNDFLRPARAHRLFSHTHTQWGAAATAAGQPVGWGPRRLCAVTLFGHTHKNQLSATKWRTYAYAYAGARGGAPGEPRSISVCPQLCVRLPRVVR